ncbi:MAG: AgmX/PglI C-terminal domain-containing protein, partial [Myxococcaceae bacterium]|nr:AgmX/PglI C-terminal domain-containing protein [Myxococcaceae bacterium]
APLSGLVVASGAVAFGAGVAQVAAAVAFAAPRDRAIITVTGFGEALAPVLLGLAGAAGVLLSVSVGCMLGAFAQRGVARRLVVVAGAVAALLGAIAVASHLRLRDVVETLSAVSTVAPVDRERLVLAASAEATGTSLTVLLGLLVAVVAAGAVALKATPRLALLVPVLGLGGLAGNGAYAVALSRAKATVEGFAVPPPGYVPLAGRPVTTLPTRCLEPRGIVSCDERLPQPAEALDDELLALLEARKQDGLPATVAIGLVPGASGTTLVHLLEASLSSGATGVELVGQRAPMQGSARGEFAIVAPLVRDFLSGVEVGLRDASEARCGEGCVKGAVVNGALVVDGEAWKPVAPAASPKPASGDVWLAVDPALSPEQVATFGLAAASRGRRLVLTVDSTSAGGDAGARGGLSKEAIAEVVAGRRDEIRRCYERALQSEGPSLAGRVLLRWTVSVSGAVRDVRVVSSSLPSEAVKQCLIDEVEQLEFPRPVDGGEVVVNYPWVFQVR